MTLNTFSPTSNVLSSSNLPSLTAKSSVIVVGAGAFGGWSALSLLRKGLSVTLLDAWGPGNFRSSSGDETRVIRSTYGNNEFYFDLNVRALALWKEHEKHWNKKLFSNQGVIWFCYDEKTSLVDDSIPFAKKHKLEYEYLDLPTLKRKYPLINTSDLHHAWFDPFGGSLNARESCQAVTDAFIKEGGHYIQERATPGKIIADELSSIRLANGTTLKADAYLFACGSWMGQLFPTQLSERIIPTRQEVYYLGTPGGQSLAYDSMPVWVDVDGSDFYYGIPGNNNKGFKIGVDRRGERFDPTNGDRSFNPDVLAHAMKFIAQRFPGLKNAPLLESRVCPYENSPDGNFIFETHPEAGNLIFLGGGSGHGFKHGPALGELVANVLAG